MLQSEDIFYPDTVITTEEISKTSQDISSVSFDENLVSTLIDLRSKLAHNKNADGASSIAMPVTDRMFRFAVRILKAEAWWNGRSKIQEDDFEILQHVLWSDPKDKPKIYSTILEVINPDKDKIMQLYYDCVDLYDKIKDGSSGATTDKAKKDLEPKAFETAQKIRNAKSKISEHIKDLEAKGRKVDDLKLVAKKVEGLLNDVYEKTLGTTGFKGWSS